MAGYLNFTTGQVLTAAQVNGFLMEQSVMAFADAAARDAALGTAVAGGNALREGMVAWLDDDDELLAYDGSAWNPVGAGFTQAVTLTGSDGSYSIPVDARKPGVRVTVIGGGGGGGNGGDASSGARGGTGGTTTFAPSDAGSVSAGGGLGGFGSEANTTPAAPTGGRRTANMGMGGVTDTRGTTIGQDGQGGLVVVAYVDLSTSETAVVTIGAGGAGVSTAKAGGSGGRGEVILEF